MLRLVPAGHGAELHPYPVLMVMIRKITVMAKTLTLHTQTTGSHYLMNWLYLCDIYKILNVTLDMQINIIWKHAAQD